MDKGDEQAWSFDAQVPDLALVLLNKRYDMRFCLYAHFVYPFQHQALQTSLAHAIPSAHPMAPSWLQQGVRCLRRPGRFIFREFRRPYNVNFAKLKNIGVEHNSHETCSKTS
jgi:hypothetical protein